MMVPIKAEGTAVLYDPEGFDLDETTKELVKLYRKWFKTRKVRQRIHDLERAIDIWAEHEDLHR